MAKREKAHKKKEIIFETDKMPTESFLKLIEESVDLTDMDKEFIREEVRNQDVYTHARLMKYKQDGEVFLQIGESIPRKVIGNTSKGNPIVTGGCGSTGIFKLKWSYVEGTPYVNE